MDAYTAGTRREWKCRSSSYWSGSSSQDSCPVDADSSDRSNRTGRFIKDGSTDRFSSTDGSNGTDRTIEDGSSDSPNRTDRSNSTDRSMESGISDCTDSSVRYDNAAHNTGSN